MTKYSQDLDPFKVALALPIGDGLVEALDFATEEMRVVFDNIYTKGLLGKVAGFKVIDCLRPRYRGHGVNVVPNIYPPRTWLAVQSD